MKEKQILFATPMVHANGGKAMIFLPVTEIFSCVTSMEEGELFIVNITKVK